MRFPIYLDYAATTPVDPRVVEKMLCYLTREGEFANPASNHVLGKAVKKAVESAREQVAAMIDAEPAEIIWTSGATESDNLAIKGAASLYQRKGKHIITTKTEHKAILDSCAQLEKQGFLVTYLTPEKNGLINQQEFRDALRADTILVSLMHVNNEIGAIEDLQSIAEITAARGVLLHVDAAQSAGKIPISVRNLAIDFISFSAHKIYGPKGIGALYVRRKPRVRVDAQIHGGGQEQGMRSGTLATHQIVAMGEAFRIAKQEMQQDYQHVKQCREVFLQKLSALKNILVNGDLERCFPGILNIRFEGKRADAILAALPEIAASKGSACDSKGVEPSYVLRAMGLNTTEAESAIRFSFGRFTTLEEVEFAAQRISEVV